MRKSEKALAVIRSLLLIGVAGALAIKAAQFRTGISGEDLFTESPVWTVTILLTAGSFFVALLILLPVFIFLKSNEIQTTEGIPMPWWAPIAILLGFPKPNWLVPKTVSIPLLVIMSVLGGFVTYTLLMGLIFGLLLQ